MNNPQWILQRTPNGRLLGTSIKRRGKVFHCAAVQEISDSSRLKGKACICMDSYKTVVEVAEFPLVKKNILQLQVKNRIELLAIFDVNEAFTISHKLISQQAQVQLLSIIAIPEELIVSGIHKLTESYNIDLINCVSMAASVASLLQQLSHEAFIVLLISRHKAYVLGVQDGNALFIQGVPIGYGGEVEPDATMHAITIGRQTLASKFEIESSRFLCMGEERGKVNCEDLGEENWTPDWSHCLKANGQDVLHYPALFGTLFTHGNYSYLPDEYVLALRLKQLSRSLVFAASFGTVLLSGLYYMNLQKIIPLRAQLQKERMNVSQDIDRLRQKLPSPDTVSRINSYIHIEEGAAQQASVSQFLQRIASVLPDNVLLLGMEITRKSGSKEQENLAVVPAPGQFPAMEPELSGQTTSKAKAESLLEQQLSVQFSCISEGDYSRVKARFEKAVKGFSSLFALRSISWGYDENNSQGHLDCELLLNGEKK